MTDLLSLKQDFTSIVQKAQPWILSHFVMWLDLKVAEYKVNGYMVLDQGTKVSFSVGSSSPGKRDFAGDMHTKQKSSAPPSIILPKQVQSSSSRNSTSASDLSHPNVFSLAYTNTFNSASNSPYVTSSIASKPAQTQMFRRPIFGLRANRRKQQHVYRRNSSNRSLLTALSNSGLCNFDSTRQEDRSRETDALSQDYLAASKSVSPSASQTENKYSAQTDTVRLGGSAEDTHAEDDDSDVIIKENSDDFEVVQNTNSAEQNAGQSFEQTSSHCDADQKSPESPCVIHIDDQEIDAEDSGIHTDISNQQGEAENEGNSDSGCYIVQEEHNLSEDVGAKDSNELNITDQTVDALQLHENETQNSDANVEQFPTQNCPSGQDFNIESSEEISCNFGSGSDILLNIKVEKNDDAQYQSCYMNNSVSVSESINMPVLQVPNHSVSRSGYFQSGPYGFNTSRENQAPAGSSTSFDWNSVNLNQYLDSGQPNNINTSPVGMQMSAHNSGVNGTPGNGRSQNRYTASNAESSPRKGKSEQAPGNLMCHLCGAVFRFRSSLSRHKSLHGEKRFHCFVCPKAFHRKEHLLLHLQRHATAAMVTCPICHIRTTSVKHLEEHYRLNHGHDHARHLSRTVGDGSQTFPFNN